MATDNLNTTPLFPDVSEHWHDTAASAESANPVEPVAVEPVAVEPVAVEPVAVEPVAVEPVAVEPVAVEPVAAEPVAVEPVLAYSEFPTDVFPVLDTAEGPGNSDLDVTAADEYDEELRAVDVHGNLYPAWATAHIPDAPLEEAAPAARGGMWSAARNAIPRRPNRPAAIPSDPPPTSDPSPEPEPIAVAPQAVPSPKQGKRWVLPVAASAVCLIAVAGVYAVTSSDPESPNTPEPAAAPPASSPSAAPAPSWCEASAVDGVIVGNGKGSQETGPALIQAFDHAYYVGRDGQAVAGLMARPNPVAEIQASIDSLDAGIEHCLTITPTATDSVYDVALTLRTSAGATSTIPQRITVSGAPGNLKIAGLEEIS